MSKNIDEILNNQDKKIVEIYMDLQDYYEEKFGNDVVILYELGSFYELYQVENKGKAIEISRLINILLTKKNKKIDKVDISNPHMCGLPSIKLDKYIDILLREEKYTIIIVSQIGTSPNIKRKIDRIISPGTNLDFNNKNKSNYISSIFIEKGNNDILIGASTYIDLSSGNVFTYEIFGTNDDKELALDELYKLSNTYYGKESVLTLDGFNDVEKDEVIAKLGLTNKSYIVHNLDFYKNSLNINYQNKLLQSIYNLKTMLSPIEHFDMENFPNMTTSLIILLEFIIEHNNSIVNNLKEPNILNNQQYLILGNNAAEQMEMLSSGNNKGLIDILTKGCSTYGKRFINQRLLNPILDKKEILRRYSNSYSFVKSNNVELIFDNLSKIYDVERLFRKILIKNIHPFEFSNFYNSLTYFMKIYKIIISDTELNNLDFIKDINIKELISLYQDIKKTFDLDLLPLYSLNSIDSSFINIGINDKLDEYKEEYALLYKEIENLANDFVKLIDSSKEYNNLDTIVKINNNDTEGFFFTVTKKRYDLIKSNLIHSDSILNHHNVNLKNDFTYKTLTGTVKITSEKMKEVSDKLILLYNNILKETLDVYNAFIDNINLFKEVIDKTIISLGEIEFSILNANLYKFNAYSIPEILDLEDSFYEAIELRHPIIERLEEKGLFVPNDVVLGKKEYMSINNTFENFYNEKETDSINGIMLYGINSSGKTSLIKSVGLSVVLAQSGMFVSAKQLRYTIYDSIFTRISGKDDLYRGLSSFAVEMLELKNIFNRVNKKSLVLGDEISHGTETISGMSIVAATIINLIKNNFNFMFATHLHQLNDLEEVKSLKNMINLHLAVKYDEQQDKLIYNRKLTYGSGSSVYGLEFAKYLKLDKEFLKVANDIRMKIAEDLTNIEFISKKKTSSYNKNVFFTKCAFCNHKATEIHHIKEQQNSNNGVVDHHRLNHEFNLVPLCQKHHDIVHKYQNPNDKPLLNYIQTSDGIELEIDEILKDKL